MLRFNLVSAEGNTFVYSYFPEGDTNDPGMVRFEMGSDEFTIEKLPKADEFRRYAFHLVKKLRATKEGNPPTEGICAWY